MYIHDAPTLGTMTEINLRLALFGTHTEKSEANFCGHLTETKILSRWIKRKQQNKGNRCKQFRLHHGNSFVPIQKAHALIES